MTNGTRYIVRHRLDTFVTIAWPLSPGDEPWVKLLLCMAALGLGRKVRLGPYIRVLGIGDAERTPHVHFVVDRASAGTLARAASRLGPPETRVQMKAVTSPDRLLGYLYDQNFVPLVRDPERPKRVRLISGSRGMSYGFPKFRKEVPRA